MPKDWWILFDVDYEDLWICCGRIMKLWDDWSMADLRSAPLHTENTVSHEEGWMGDPELGTDKLDTRDSKMTRENSWRRAWILSQGRRAVRKWVEERAKDEPIDCTEA